MAGEKILLPCSFILLRDAPTVLDNGSLMFSIKTDDGRKGIIFVNGKITGRELCKFKKGDWIKMGKDEVINDFKQGEGVIDHGVTYEKVQALMTQLTEIVIESLSDVESSEAKSTGIVSMTNAILIGLQKEGNGFEPLKKQSTQE